MAAVSTEQSGDGASPITCDADFELLVSVVHAAAMMLLDGLSALCVTVVIRHVDHSNVVSMLSLGHSLGLPRLSAFCLDFLVLHFVEVLGEPVEYGQQPSAGLPLIIEPAFAESNMENIVTHAPSLAEIEQWMLDDPDNAVVFLKELITQHCADHWEMLFERKIQRGLSDSEMMRLLLPEILS
jgi:hypothetical protein